MTVMIEVGYYNASARKMIVIRHFTSNTAEFDLDWLLRTKQN